MCFWRKRRCSKWLDRTYRQLGASVCRCIWHCCRVAGGVIGRRASFGRFAAGRPTLPSQTHDRRCPVIIDCKSHRPEIGAGGGTGYEVQQLLRIGREEEAEYIGEIESIRDGEWTVDGITVVISADTRIEGQPSVGQHAEIEGVTRNDVLFAVKVEIEDGPEEDEDSHTPLRELQPTPVKWR